ncbi:MAG: hypothetical protein K2M49_04540 [Muribaculaceae bacterium]|nr:hypothetical protein [Muribaculaceae bacterium]
MLKKAIFSVTAVLLLVAACLSYSCSADYNEPQQIVKTSQEQAEEEILAEFIEFNKTLTPREQSRGTSWYKWIKIVCEDADKARKGANVGSFVGKFFGPEGVAVGAVIGGTVCGSVASYIKYDELSKKMEVASTHANSNSMRNYEQSLFCDSYALAEKSIKQNDYEIGLSLRFDSTTTKIGILHNKVLDIVCDSNGSAAGVGISAELDSIQHAIITDPIFVIQYNSIVNDAEQGDLITEPTARKKTMNDKIMDQFYYALETSCSSKDDLYYIIEQYKLMIRKFGTEGYEDAVFVDKDGNIKVRRLFLSINDMNELNISLAVAAYSYDYWSTVFPYVED